MSRTWPNRAPESSGAGEASFHAVNPLVRKRERERHEFIKELRSDYVQSRMLDDKFFAEVVKLAINDYGVAPVNLANALPASTAAISRWASGKAAPPAHGRSHIVEVIAVLLERDLTSQQEPVRSPPSQKRVRSRLRKLQP
jgi:hypothetical protein